MSMTKEEVLAALRYGSSPAHACYDKQHAEVLDWLREQIKNGRVGKITMIEFPDGQLGTLWDKKGSRPQAAGEYELYALDIKPQEKNDESNS